MTLKFKTIDDAVTFIRTNYWGGLDHSPGRENTKDRYSSETGIRDQYNPLIGAHAIFFFVTYDPGMTPKDIRFRILRVKINPDMESV
jgi:hypothetical protein